jgi:hypothetical protein
MLVFATSDKGGTGRSVTSSNIVYRRALQGNDTCYVDFDFGSPTVGAIFNIGSAARGTSAGGTHSYLQEEVAEPCHLDVWSESDRQALRSRPAGAGRLVLLPGDAGGGEFPVRPGTVERCAKLLLRLEEEFDLCLIDLSAGRSYAAAMVLAATARPELRGVRCRWLVFHRWTRQHIIAAGGLVRGPRGIVEVGRECGHDPDDLLAALRFVRTAVLEQDADELQGLRSEQLAWLSNCNRDLKELASKNQLGRTAVLGSIPLDPVLQWREQLISEEDVYATRIANEQTLTALDELAKRVIDNNAWEGL